MLMCYFMCYFSVVLKNCSFVETIKICLDFQLMLLEDKENEVPDTESKKSNGASTEAKCNGASTEAAPKEKQIHLPKVENEVIMKNCSLPCNISPKETLIHLPKVRMR